MVIFIKLDIGKYIMMALENSPPHRYAVNILSKDTIIYLKGKERKEYLTTVPLQCS